MWAPPKVFPLLSSITLLGSRFTQTHLRDSYFLRIRGFRDTVLTFLRIKMGKGQTCLERGYRRCLHTRYSPQMAVSGRHKVHPRWGPTHISSMFLAGESKSQSEGTQQIGQMVPPNYKGIRHQQHGFYSLPRFSNLTIKIHEKKDGEVRTPNFSSPPTAFRVIWSKIILYLVSNKTQLITLPGLRWLKILGTGGQKREGKLFMTCFRNSKAYYWAFSQDAGEEQKPNLKLYT